MPEKHADVSPKFPAQWEGEEGLPLTERQQRWVDIFFTLFIASGTAAGISFGLFESWIVSLVCAVAATVYAIVLLRRGDKIF